MHDHVEEMMPRPMMAANKWIVPKLKMQPVESFFPNLHESQSHEILGLEGTINII